MYLPEFGRLHCIYLSTMMSFFNHDICCPGTSGAVRRVSGMSLKSATAGTFISEVVDSSDSPQYKIQAGDTPVLPVEDFVLFPLTSAPVRLQTELQIRTAEWCAEHHVYGLVVSQREPGETPRSSSLERTGTLCRIFRVLELPDGSKTALVLGEAAYRIARFKKRSPIITAEIEQLDQPEPDMESSDWKVVMQTVTECYEDLVKKFAGDDAREMLMNMKALQSGLPLLHHIATQAPVEREAKQKMLEIDDPVRRAEELYRQLLHSHQLLKIKQNIASRTHEDLSRQQREHFLQQQMRIIQDELGGTVEDEEENDLMMRAEAMNWPEEAKGFFDKELKKLSRLNVQNPEYSVQYTYLATLLSLPWLNVHDDDYTIQHVEEVLDRDHYGLSKVKERIAEQVAVLKLRRDMKAPIICLYGPPGVGKTSLGKSIAEAMGRDYARVSLGGLHDESEVRGHRRTYIGAMPGRIMAALAKCGTNNPVFVLDEIDKIGKDFKGDPSTALLEVLDPEQNNKFHDNYIDFDYDLSKVMFVATANDLSTISRPLLDRMEVIEIGGYVPDEKVEIALRHLVPKILVDHGFASDEVVFTREALLYVVDRYTREAGVRQLEKKLAKAVRRIARLKASDKPYPVNLGKEEIRDFLGIEEVTPDEYENNDFAGVVTGLAWTQSGGDILFIESTLIPGKDTKLSLTGNLGDVMKESATIALKYVQANAAKLGVDPAVLAANDIHIHVPEGAIPKDGPSAGITMVTSIVSSLTRRKVRPKIAMTGEITLRGKVLPVGGIKEKILAAKRAGMTDIVLCSVNRKDIDEIEPRYIDGLTFHYVDRIQEVVDYALLPEVATE